MLLEQPLPAQDDAAWKILFIRCHLADEAAILAVVTEAPDGALRYDQH